MVSFEVPDSVKRVIARSGATLNPECAVDLDRRGGETICPGGDNGDLKARDSDIRLARTERRILHSPGERGRTFHT